MTCPSGPEALREKPRESSGPGSCKSGDRWPKGAGILPLCQEGWQCEISVLTFGSLYPAAASECFAISEAASLWAFVCL